MKNPFLKFYTSDWRSDPALKMCSMAARGLWIELICLMHESTPYGHLLVNGQSVTDAQLGALVGVPPDQITALLGELEAAGVFSRTRAGVIYSRKLTRLAKKAAVSRNNGRKGGNPTLGKQKENITWDNPRVNHQDKPQKPEARVQIEIHGGGDARAREADPPPPDKTVDPPSPDKTQTFRERILVAIGVDRASGLTGYGGTRIGTNADMLEARRWVRDLGLTGPETIEIIAEVMSRKADGPPSSFKFFSKAMQRFAAQKAAAAEPLRPDHFHADPAPASQPKMNIAAMMADISRERSERNK